MKKISFIIISFMIFINVFAQNPNDALIKFTGGGIAIVQDFKPVKKSDIIKGSYYYNDDWY